MISLPCGLESKTQTSKQNPIESLRHETTVDQRLRVVGEEQNVCKGAQHLGENDTPGSECQRKGEG